MITFLRRYFLIILLGVILISAFLAAFYIFRDNFPFFQKRELLLMENDQPVVFGVEKLKSQDVEEYRISALINGRPRLDDMDILKLPIKIPLPQSKQSITLDVIFTGTDNIGTAIVSEGEIEGELIWEQRSFADLQRFLEKGRQVILYVTTGFNEAYLKRVLENCEAECKKEIGLVNRYGFSTAKIMDSLSTENNGDEIGVATQLLIGDYK